MKKKTAVRLCRWTAFNKARKVVPPPFSILFLSLCRSLHVCPRACSQMRTFWYFFLRHVWKKKLQKPSAPVHLIVFVYLWRQKASKVYMLTLSSFFSPFKNPVPPIPVRLGNTSSYYSTSTPLSSACWIKAVTFLLVSNGFSLPKMPRYNITLNTFTSLV